MPERKAVKRRQDRVRENLHLLPKDAQAAILESFEANGDHNANGDRSDPRARHRDEDPDTASIPTQRGY
jgi:phospholipid/cholesterol/gamma-HCH transport system ATP-binding protein